MTYSDFGDSVCLLAPCVVGQCRENILKYIGSTPPYPGCNHNHQDDVKNYGKSGLPVPKPLF